MEWAKANGFQTLAVDKVFPVREHQYSETLGSHRELWPFFKRAEALGMPIVLHNIQHGHRISNLMVFQRDGLDIVSRPRGAAEPRLAVHERAFRRLPESQGRLYRGGLGIYQAAGRAARCGVRESAGEITRTRTPRRGSTAASRRAESGCRRASA
jgi:hypothetical protein